MLIPDDGWSNPTDKRIAEFFSAMAQPPQQTIAVHCWLGEDSTGVFVATYRTAFEHWTPQQALAEINRFHFHSFWPLSMQDYVRHFPDRWATCEVLLRSRALPATASPASTSAD